jgi:hypothetical protein
MAAAYTHATIEELLEAVFSMRSLPRLYKEEQLRLLATLGTAVRRVGCWCEMAARMQECEPGAGERPLVKTHQTEI